MCHSLISPLNMRGKENLPRQVPQVWFVDREEPPRNGRTETFSHPGQDSIHRSMTSLLVTAQLFGLMPVQGITAPSPSRLRFHWRSLRVLYCLVVLVCSIILLGISCARLARIGVTFPRTAGTLFFVVHILAIVLFLQLARRWPHLMWEWARVESAFTHYGPPPRLARTFRAVTATVMLAALVEHLLSNAKSLRTFYFLCPDNWVRLFASSHYHAFEVVPYAPLWIPVFALFNLLSTFSWSYVDVFLMLLSVGVSARFRQLNRRLAELRAQFLPELLWRQLREDYNSLSYLTKTVDSCVSKLVLLSFGNNLYFICVQLLNSMNPMSPNLLDAVYFYWSFGYLLLKTCAVSLLAADIFDRSKEPKTLLYSVPPESYCEEVERFLAQVVSDDVALTGLNFFSVTRTLLLTVAGTIVTYEIVLVQFNNLGESDEPTQASNETIMACREG